MSDAIRVPDLAERERALDPARSFIVQAPAGSGKTELLIQRFLALLARVERPEEIAAITFTIKAAAEMRNRIFDALRSARNDPRPAAEHSARTWDLARAAIERNDALGWKLEESADRLRVQTIDALCASLTRQMPVLSRFGAQPESLEDASALYSEAARNVLARLEQDGGDLAPHVARLLSHLDNNAAEAERLIAAMLEQRDHWIRTLPQASDRRTLEATLAKVRRATVERLCALWPEPFPCPSPEAVDAWVAHANAFLTKEGEWRKSAAQVLKDSEGLHAALEAVQSLPDARYTDEQWDALEAIVSIASPAVAELQWVFGQHGKADFVEIAQGALRALEGEDGPTDLMLALDYRIRHLLVDEFQDTSITQFDLLQKLTSGWEPDDGRTLFLVGDPMQSIYRFREAEVGRFLQAWHGGIGHVPLGTLTLTANFRSQAGIVDWVNATFSRIMPAVEDIPSGAVKYSASESVHAPEDRPVEVHPFFNGDYAGEGRRVAEIAGAARATGTVAILVRNRSHLLSVMPRLREAGVPFRAIEIEPLGHRPVVQDLLALTRALSHPGDRTAWLAVLRAPWCGLTLADLTALASDAGRTVWECASDAAKAGALSPDGEARLARTREILEAALAGRRRTSLRVAVEDAWQALGGPAAVEDVTDLEDAEIYLDHLEDSENGGSIADIAAFESSVAKLFALPDLAASDTLQVMTIHKAKGLEFDTVIVPGLGSGTGRDDRKLFMWMETPDTELLLAPINPTGSKDDSIYEFIRNLDKEKADHESARLLYVAATRARHRLHLLGDVNVDEHGETRKPAKGSLLAKLWPVLAKDFKAPEAPVPTHGRPSLSVAAQGELRRLPVDALRYDVPAAVKWTPSPEEARTEPIEFSWVGDTARRVGSVVHRWLQRIADDEAKGWTRARVKAERPAIAHELAARGVAEAEIKAATDRVIDALTASVEDKRGRWLLGPQRNARNEYRLSTVVDGVRRMLVIDRMFEDDVGDTFIVDYKTSSHEGADLDRFLAEEENRYREQLERYVVAAGRLDARRGLYFPLLKGWREWTSNERKKT
jgi:ATP-dependent helicase/nuclease subunit A